MNQKKIKRMCKMKVKNIKKRVEKEEEYFIEKIILIKI